MSVEVDNVPGVMATEDALVILQESVLVPAEATVVGEAPKEVMVGDEPPPLVGVHVPDEVKVQISFPPEVVCVPPVAVICAEVGAEIITIPEPPVAPVAPPPPPPPFPVLAVALEGVPADQLFAPAPPVA